MLRIKLETKARPQSSVPRERTLDPLGREPVSPEYEPSWVVDADEDFMIETAAVELEELDVLSAEIRYRDAFYARSVGDTFGAIAPHLPSLGAFLLEKRSGSINIDFFENGLFLAFFFRQESLVSRVRPQPGGEVPPEDVCEANPNRLSIEVCRSLLVFITAVEAHLPHLHRRKEYQVWLNSPDSAVCMMFCREQGMMVEAYRP